MPDPVHDRTPRPRQIRASYSARTIGVDITRERSVRVQWDPERDLRFAPLDHRSIQIGLSREALDRYVEGWIQGIEDLTEVAVAIGERVRAGDLVGAAALLPEERIYPVPPAIAASLGMRGAP